MQVILSGEEAKSQEKVAGAFHESLQAQQLMAALTLPAGKQQSSFLYSHAGAQV